MSTKNPEKNDSNEFNKVETPFIDNNTNLPVDINKNKEKFPIKTICSIQYNKYEMEIFKINDEKKGFLFWLEFLVSLIVCFPIAVIVIFLINGKCCPINIEKAYIYKKRNKIVIKRKEDISCYLMFLCRTSYYDIKDIKSFEVNNTSNGYEIKVIDYNDKEDIIIILNRINRKDCDVIINFLNSLIDN